MGLLAALRVAAAVEVSGKVPSPDGRWVFGGLEAEVPEGMLPWVILEAKDGRQIWQASAEVGHEQFLEASMHWGPDSKRFVLISRTGPRQLEAVFFEHDGKGFQQRKWSGAGQLEEWVDEEMDANRKRAGGSAEEGGGGSRIEDVMAVERWVGDREVIVRRSVTRQSEMGPTDGMGRALVEWNAKTGECVIRKRLPAPRAWPMQEEPEGFEVTHKESVIGGLHREIHVKEKATGKELQIIAESYLTAPILLEAAEGWPQIELHAHGPEEFMYRKLYRVQDGDYRCVRIDEMTGIQEHAPWDAPRVELHEGYALWLMKSRDLKPGEDESFKPLHVDHVSRDGRWMVRMDYDEQRLTRCEVRPGPKAPKSAKAKLVLLDTSDDETSGLNTASYAVWSPDAGCVAWYSKEGPRVGDTLLAVWNGKGWTKVQLPLMELPFQEELNRKGGHWRTQYARPLRWADAKTLVLALEGTIRPADEEVTVDYRYEAEVVKGRKADEWMVRTIREVPLPVAEE